MKKSTSVLIIEDEQVQMKALTTRLQREGFKVWTALDGEEGLRRLHETKPDIILLDIILPRLNGLEVLKQLQQEKNRIPVIVLSNLSDETTVQGALDRRATDYLIKTDYSLDDVVQKIYQRLRAKSPRHGRKK